MTGTTAAYQKKEDRRRSKGAPSLLRNSAVLAGILAGLILCGFLLICAAYCIPTDAIYANIKEEPFFFRRGFTSQLMAGYADGSLNDWSDTHMIVSAVTATDESIVEQAMLNRHYGNEETDPVNVFADIFQRGKSIDDTTVYARYWNGYLVALKPLLAVFTYSKVLYINMLLQLGLLAYLVYTYVKKRKALYCVPLLAVWLFLNPISLSLSIFLSTVWIITLIALICLENAKFNSAWAIPAFFMVIGAATSYFDLLSYPLITLGIPLSASLERIDGNWKKRLLTIIGYCVMWGIGYGGMWAGKIVLGVLLTDVNVLNDAVDTARLRSGYDVGSHGLSYSITYRNIFNSVIASLNPIFVALFVPGLGLWCWRALKRHELMPSLDKLLPCALICVMPFLWYMVFANHTYCHSFFTHRALGVSIYGLLICCITLYGAGKPKNPPDICNQPT